MAMFNNQLISTLNNFEFKVYNYVMKHHQTVVYMTIRELAEASDVSTATILRFCKKMNCSGYAEFKAYLKMNTERRGQLSIPHGANEFLSFFKSINNEEFDTLIMSAAEQIAPTSASSATTSTIPTTRSTPTCTSRRWRSCSPSPGRPPR